MKKNTPVKYAQALYEMTKEKMNKGDLDSILKSFVELLVRHRALSQINEIVSSFVHHVKKQEGVMELTITAARSLDPEVIKRIEDTFGENVESKEIIDKQILGGFIVRRSDTIFDASVRTQLQRLEKQLQ